MIRTDFTTDPTITTRPIHQPANYRWLEDKDKATVDYTLEFKQIRKNCEVKERRRSATGVITDTEVAGSFGFHNGGAGGHDFYSLQLNKIKSRIAKLTGTPDTHYAQLATLKFPAKSIAIILRPPPVIQKSSRHTYEGYISTKGYWIGTPTLKRNGRMINFNLDISLTKTETATLYCPHMVWKKDWINNEPHYSHYYAYEDIRNMYANGTETAVSYWIQRQRWADVEPIMVKGMITESISYNGEHTMEADLLRPDETLSGLKGTRKLPTSDISLFEELAQAVYHPDRLFGKEGERDADGLGGMNKAYPGWDDAMNGIVGVGTKA